MITVFIPQDIVDFSERRAKMSFVGKVPFSGDGLLWLYNKNSNENYGFLNPRKSETAPGWIAECDQIPEYFSNVIHEISQTDRG